MNTLPNATEEKITIGDRPTPITDALVPTQGRKQTMLEYIETLESHARNLERQLAEAREELAAARAWWFALADAGADLRAELAAERALADQLGRSLEVMIDCAKSGIRAVKCLAVSEKALAAWKEGRKP